MCKSFGFIQFDFFERNTVGEAPIGIFIFKITRTQIRVREDLNMGGCVVHLIFIFFELKIGNDPMITKIKIKQTIHQ